MKSNSSLCFQSHILFLLSLIVAVSGCSRLEPIPKPVYSKISQEILEKIGAKRIYFAHMSVGYNILDGISALTGDTLNIREIKDGVNWDIPVFYHSPIGENTKPYGKIDNFSAMLNSGIAENIDVAILKFCYVDITGNTEAQSLFEYYRKMIREQELRYPDVTFVHMTVPLTRMDKGIKSFAKGLMGQDLNGSRDNLKRQEYNELIRKNYAVVFDLAEIESTRLNGKRSAHTLNGLVYYSLAPEFTSDGGHLNEAGSNLVAQKLLHYISVMD